MGVMSVPTTSAEGYWSAKSLKKGVSFWRNNYEVLLRLEKRLTLPSDLCRYQDQGL